MMIVVDMTAYCYVETRTKHLTPSIPFISNVLFYPVHHVLSSFYADFIQELSKEIEKNLIRSFNFKFLYIDDLLSLNKVDDFVDFNYVVELEKKHFTDTEKSTSYPDLHLDIDSEGLLRPESFYK